MLRSAEASTGVGLHEETFLARYRRLLGWALQLTGGDHEQAEDLVHDAFIQYTFSRPDLAGIQNLDGYLYSMLRNLRLSQIRRRERLPGQSLSALQYDSAELSLRAVDPRDQIKVQDELRQICRYACIRKETSKAGSVLLLRFMLGYYPREIAQVIQGSREAAEERLRAARGEARLFLENPSGLRFLGRPNEVSTDTGGYARPSEEFLRELRHAVFSSCRGDCLSAERLAALYRVGEPPIEAEMLAHIVSCPRCLDAVNRMLGLPLLSERYATDTLGTDTRPKGGGTPATSKEHIARRCRKRALETFEHRPQELRISVNGYIMASQKIGQPLSEQALSVAAVERIDFVEVFSEQEIRLLLLCVDEQPPGGPHSRFVKVEFSEGRTLEATLSFSSPWPIVQVAYHDPLLWTEVVAPRQPVRAVDLPDTMEPAAAAVKTGAAAGRNQAWRRLPGALADALRGLASPGLWLRPGVMTAAASLVIFLAALFYLRTENPTISAAGLLERSAAAEKATAAEAGFVLHRTISLEALRPGAETPVRRRIEVWQSAARGENVRRVYDEGGNLLAGEWEDTHGAGIVYRRGGAAQKQTEADVPTKTLLTADDIWRIDLSSGEFSTLVGGAARVSAEENASEYVLSYAGRADAETPRLTSATLILSKSDLRARSQTLVVEGAEGKREYRFVETGFSRQDAGSVNPAVFRPEQELLGDFRERGQPEETSSPDGAPRQPSAGDAPAATVASAELEIEVNYLLDQIKANLGEQVSVERTTGGKLRVEALVESEQRKGEILRALAPILNNPAVVAEVSTVEDALRRRKGKATAPRGEEVQEIEVASARIPADEDLRRYFSARLGDGARVDKEIERFATRAMNRSRQALMHASALKRLASRFSPAEMRSLTPEARAKWQTMIREHARGCREQTAALRRELRPVFSPGAGGESVRERADDDSLRRDAERLLRLGYAHDETMRSAFTLSDGAQASGSLKSPQLWRSLAAAESLAGAIEAAYEVRRD